MRTDLKGEITVSAFLSFCLCDLLLVLNAGELEAEFLDEIQKKVSRVFLLAIHSHLYSFALRCLFLQTNATSYNFYFSY
jgi:hypothetical protein